MSPGYNEDVIGGSEFGPEEVAPNGIEYLREKLEDRCRAFHGSVAWFRRRYYAATMSTVLLSAAITIIAGMEGDWVNKYLAKNVVVALGALSTVLSAWGAFFSPRDSWHLYADTLSKLRALQARIAFAAANSGDSAFDASATAKLFDEYQAILNSHNSHWTQIRSKGNA